MYILPSLMKIPDREFARARGLRRHASNKQRSVRHSIFNAAFATALWWQSDLHMLGRRACVEQFCITATVAAATAAAISLTP